MLFWDSKDSHFCNGKQFDSKEFREFYEELGIEQRFTSVAYPQTNGTTEVTNRTILQGLKRSLDSCKGKCLEELPNILWSYKTTPRSATRETSFSLCFGAEVMIPGEIRSKSLRNIAFDKTLNDQLLYVSLALIDEVREQGARRDIHY